MAPNRRDQIRMAEDEISAFIEEQKKKEMEATEKAKEKREEEKKKEKEREVNVRCHGRESVDQSILDG